MAKRGSITDTQDQRAKIEYARRKNRRASITEQFVVPLVNFRKEKSAQSRHHAFLLQSENLSAIHEIIDRVKQIAESDPIALGHTLSPMDKRRLVTWGNGVLTLLKEFVPSERHENDPLLQLLEMIQTLQEGHVCLAEVAIDARQIVERWERLGMFDDFRSSDEEDVEGDQRVETPILDMRSPQQIALERELEKRRKMESSYAYQRVRERAAARVIKRNTLTWVRSRAAFRSRVEELEVFGNTTAALVEELTSLSALQRRAAMSSASNTNDIFDLMKGKKLAGGKKIDFSDLMHFSKHLALFTVDHAIRRIDEIESKRRLFQLRCLIKLQIWWRKMHEIVKGRRMLKLVEEMRRKKEQEHQAESSRVKELKAKGAAAGMKGGDLNGRKPSKVTAKSTKALAVTVSTSANTSSRSVALPKTEFGEKSQGIAKHSSRAVVGGKDAKSVMPTPPVTPRSSTITGGGGNSRPKKSLISSAKVDDKADKMARAARAREARLRREFEEELQRHRQEYEEAERDTEDVELAWRRFLESAQKTEDDSEENPDDGDSERLSTASSRLTEGLESRGATLSIAGEAEEGLSAEWREWSDDEENDTGMSEYDSHSSRGTTPQTAASSRLSTPHMSDNSSQSAIQNPNQPLDRSKPPLPSIKVVVTVKKRPPRRPAEDTSPQQEPASDSKPSSAGSSTQSLDGVLPPYATAPSPARRQLLFGASQARLLRPAIPGTGQLSKCMPFADFEPPVDFSQSRRVVVTPTTGPATTRRHLYEMDFHQTLPTAEAESGVAFNMLLQDQPLFDTSLVSSDWVSSEATQPVDDFRAGSVRVFSSTRATRVARVKAALQTKRSGQQQPQRPPVVASVGGPEQAKEVEPALSDQAVERLIVTPTASAGSRSEILVVNSTSRDVLLAPLHGRASLIAAYISNPMLKLDFRKEDIIRRVEGVQEVDTAEAEPESRETDVQMNRRKFGSHAEWLKSMGLENAVAVAARDSKSSRKHNGRKMKAKRTDDSTHDVVSSIVAIQETAASRARRKRRNEHALPLLGKRGKDPSPSKTHTNFEPMRPILPVVLDRRMREPLQPREYSAFSPMQAESVLSKRPRHVRNEPELYSGSSGEDVSSDSEDGENSSVPMTNGEEDALDCSSEDAENTEPSASTDEDGEADEGSSEGVDEGSDATTNPRRMLPRRKTLNPRANNQRRRTSLHEPKHVAKQKKSKEIRRGRHSRKNDNPMADADTVPSESNLEQEESVKRFRPRMPSLLERLIPRETQWSFKGVPGQGACTSGILTSENEHSHLHERDNTDSSEGETTLEDDPAKVAAFKRLYTQYIGLLSAAPPVVVPQ